MLAATSIGRCRRPSGGSKCAARISCRLSACTDILDIRAARHLSWRLSRYRALANRSRGLYHPRRVRLLQHSGTTGISRFYITTLWQVLFSARGQYYKFATETVHQGYLNRDKVSRLFFIFISSRFEVFLLKSNGKAFWFKYPYRMNCVKVQSSPLGIIMPWVGVCERPLSYATFQATTAAHEVLPLVSSTDSPKRADLPPVQSEIALAQSQEAEEEGLMRVCVCVIFFFEYQVPLRGRGL